MDRQLSKVRPKAEAAPTRGGGRWESLRKQLRSTSRVKYAVSVRRPGRRRPGRRRPGRPRGWVDLRADLHRSMAGGAAAAAAGVGVGASGTPRRRTPATAAVGTIVGAAFRSVAGSRLGGQRRPGHHRRTQCRAHHRMRHHTHRRAHHRTPLCMRRPRHTHHQTATADVAATW